ncbi:MAG: agmatine deiminase family protein [Gammaproteobacteria bacterium]|nr:agmatine deiminase family protein [Gammaproteobacteria bacterium]
MSQPAQDSVSPTTPQQLGFSVPGRFDRHACTLMSYPPKEEALGTDIEGFRQETVTIARAIAEFEPVKMITDPTDAASASEKLASTAGIEIVEIPIDCCWIRDNGPIFVRDQSGELAGIHFDFNGWGERVGYATTREMPGKIIEHLGVKAIQADFICEGGGISFDGEGTIITTEQVMRNQNRYAGYSREDIEKNLYDYLGIEKVIWLELGLVEDTETDGHVDNEVEFIAPGIVLVQTVKDRTNPNFDLLSDNLKRLSQARDARGRKLEIIEMGVLPYAEGPGGKPMAIPYTNAYVINGAVIAPQVDPKLDEIGYRILEQAMPGRRIIPAPSYWQAVGGGGIGCITQQVPTFS